MAALIEILGETLQSKAGNVKTSDALAGKGAIALYFSAHWCPPCRGFTPKFAQWYTDALAKKSLEVVFVSSDKDENAFNEYFAEQPWLALPFSDRERKNILSKRFKVQGIPSVILLDGEGKVINKDGRSAVSEDPTGENFPWRSRTLSEVLAAVKLVAPGGEIQSFANLTGKATALYFSAHWCPPCRGFTPKLAEWYAADLKSKGLDVVFVSSDRSEEAFKEYFAEQPWHALEYSDRQAKADLSNALGVQGIPCLVILDKDGSVITKDGRAAITEDPKGERFPWHPKPVHNMKAGPGNINEVPTVIAFCEGGSTETKEAVEAAMAPLGRKFRDEAKAKGLEDPEMSFAVITESSDLSARIRSLLQLPSLVSESARLMLLDIPDDGGFYEGPEGEIAEEVVTKLVADYQAKSLTRKQLQG